MTLESNEDAQPTGESDLSTTHADAEPESGALTAEVATPVTPDDPAATADAEVAAPAADETEPDSAPVTDAGSATDTVATAEIESTADAEPA